MKFTILKKAFVYGYCSYVRVGQNCTLKLFFISGLFVGAMYVSSTCPELNPSGFVVTNIWMINNKYIDCHLRVISLTCFLLSLPLIFLMWVTNVSYSIKRSHVVSFRNVNLMFELFDAVFCVWYIYIYIYFNYFLIDGLGLHWIDLYLRTGM